MSILLHHKKDITKEGDIIERKVWKIDKGNNFPQGIKYSLVYVHNNKRILGYDNEQGKGHHRHYYQIEELYQFIDFVKLLDDFENDVKKLRRKLYGN
ncbi:MAG: DUF6516 family protein [Nanoarchaeota archaeon]